MMRQAGPHRDKAANRPWPKPRTGRRYLRPIAPLVKSAAVVAVMIFVLAIVLIATIPYVFANKNIKEGIRSELAAMSGLPVNLRGDISLSVLPRLVATMHDVEIGDPGNVNQTGLSAQTIQVELSWLAALQRRVEIRSMHADRASIRISKDLSGNWLPDALASPLAPPLLKARMAMASNPAEPDFSDLPNWRIGSLSLANSSLSIIGAMPLPDIVSDLNADISWPGLSMPARANGTGTWRGKTAKFSLGAKDPFGIAAGGSSEVTINLASEPATFEFTGIANLQNFFFANGSLKFETPSMRALLDWLGADIDPGNAMGRMSMSAKLTTKDKDLNFDDAVINFNDNSATGVLQLKQDGSVPALSGTLAFENLDLATFLSAFPIGLNSGAARFGMGFLNQMQLDLRLSAKAAKLGNIPLSEVAAAVRIKDGSANFDLGDAGFYGGRAEANLTITDARDTLDGEMRIKIADVDAKQLDPGGTVPTLDTLVQASVEIKGKYAGFLAFVRTGEGRAEVSAAQGNVRNFDLDAFRAGLTGGKLFNLPDAYHGAAVLNSLKVNAMVNNGVAEVTDGFIDLFGARIDFSGALPVLSPGLAFSGSLMDLADPQSPAVRKFFIGGAWEHPFVTPVN